jgi:hypothetical protein
MKRIRPHVRGSKGLIQAIFGGILFVLFLLSILIVSMIDRPKSQDQSPFIPSLNWDTKWWLSPSFSAQSLSSTTNVCPLCQFTPTQIEPSSTPSDAIVTVVMGEIYGLPTTIRSMRTANITAALVVLADSTAAKLIRSSINSIIESCGVILVDVGNLDASQMKGRYRTRWHLVYDYFRLNPLGFKRFTMTDAYDSFFQGDVFLRSVKEDKLYFSTESLNLRNCPHNSAWIREIYPKALKRIDHFPIICAGPIVGGVAPFLELCRVMFGLPEWTSHWDTPPDQAYVNIVVRLGYLEEAKVSYEIVPNDGFITTVGYCDRKGNLTVDVNGNVGCPGFKTTPMLLHQYVRPKNMRPHVFNACPAGDIPWSFKLDPYSKASF